MLGSAGVCKRQDLVSGEKWNLAASAARKKIDRDVFEDVYRQHEEEEIVKHVSTWFVYIIYNIHKLA